VQIDWCFEPDSILEINFVFGMEFAEMKAHEIFLPEVELENLRWADRDGRRFALHE
jgi:hypothetical protein